MRKGFIFSKLQPLDDEGFDARLKGRTPNPSKAGHKGSQLQPTVQLKRSRSRFVPLRGESVRLQREACVWPCCA